MQFQKLTFENAEGRKLAARLDLPVDEKPVAYALFAHCFTCTKNFNAVLNINRALTKKGIAVLRFDFTGLGESEGDFSETNFSTNVSDLIAASEFLASHFEPPKLMVGHSLGGAAVLHAASKLPSVQAVSTIASPANLRSVHAFLDGTREKVEREGEAEVSLQGSKFRLTKQFLDDLQDDRMKEVISGLRKPLLIFHSPRDTIVKVDNAAEIFMAARHPKSFVSLDTADHLLSNREDSFYVGSVLASWAWKYIGAPFDDPSKQNPADNRVVVRTGKFGYQTEIQANGHRMIADEPIPVGGSDTGPSPYDLLVAALGACTSMTLRMYADRKKWPLDAITVRLMHRKIHARDCEGCDKEGAKMDHIDRELELLGDLDEDQRAKLLQIADRCPVHRTLHSPIRVETRLK
jgi:putative redox protein